MKCYDLCWGFGTAGSSTRSLLVRRKLGLDNCQDWMEWQKVICFQTRGEKDEAKKVVRENVF